MNIADLSLALEADETLLVQSGKPVAVFRTMSMRRGCCCAIESGGALEHWDRFHELDRAD